MLRDGEGIRLGSHDPIISYELFEGVAKALDDRRTQKARASSDGAMWPLRARIYCGACGRPLTSHSTRRGNIVYRYYRCRATAGGRPKNQVAAGTIEAAVADRLPRKHRGELDSHRIREHVERVVEEDDSGTVTVAIACSSDPAQFSLRIWISRSLVSSSFAADRCPAR